MTITSANAVHALLYFIVSLFSSALLFYLLGAPFVAALEVIVYAGAIIVLFLFAVMLLNLGRRGVEDEKRLLQPVDVDRPRAPRRGSGRGDGLMLSKGTFAPVATEVVGPKKVGMALFGPYLLGVEIASMLLLAGLVGAYHLGRKETPPWKPRDGESA